MIKLVDSFLKFLATNLPTYTVRGLKFDPSDQTASLLAEDCINVDFRYWRPARGSGSSIVNVDFVFADEQTAYDAVAAFQTLLFSTGYAAVYDYTNIAAPVPTGSNMFWDVGSCEFRRIMSPNYCHYSCSLRLRHE